MAMFGVRRQRRLTLKFTIFAPQTLGCASQAPFDAANARGLRTHCTRLPSPRVGEFGFEPLAHTPASRGGIDPFGQTLGCASQAPFDATNARGLHAPLAHTPASRGWYASETGNRVPSSLCPRLRLLLHFHIPLGAWPRCSRSSWMGRSSEFVRSSTAISHFFL